MAKYIAMRIVNFAPVLIVSSFMVFAMIFLLPGDPTVALLGDRATIEERQALSEKLGLDRPLPIQYVAWVGRVLSGDLGRSLRTQEPVSTMLATRIPVTLELSLLSMLLGIAIGLPAGILAAIRRNSLLDAVAGVFALAGIALPFFWLGILVIRLFSLKLAWLPPSGYVPLLEQPLENLKLMILPTITLGLSMAALVMRQTRTSMLQVLSQDFIRTARAKGASKARVLFVHALRNALIPIVTVIGLQMGALVSGAVVTETIFSLPGLGRMVVEGIFDRDIAPVQAGIVVIVLGVLVTNLATDISYAFLDRRVKL